MRVNGIIVIVAASLLALSSFSGCIGGDKKQAENAGWIYGFVNDGKGLLLSGADVSAGGKTAKSGSNGSYNIAGLAPETYNVTASLQGYKSALKILVVNAKKGTRWDFTLQPTGTASTAGWLFGLVKDVSGAPLANASISLNGTAKATADVSGAYNITVDSGLYNASASLAGYEAQFTEVRVAAGRGTGANFTLKKIVAEDRDKGFTTWINETDTITAAVIAETGVVGGTTVVTEKQGPDTTTEWYGYWKLLPADKNFTKFGAWFHAYVTWEKGDQCDDIALRYFRDGESGYVTIEPKETKDHWKFFEFECSADFADKKWYIGVYPMTSGGVGTETNMPYTIVIKNNAAA